MFKHFNAVSGEYLEAIMNDWIERHGYVVLETKYNIVYRDNVEWHNVLIRYVKEELIWPLI